MQNDMTQKDLYEIRAKRFSEGRCPICNVSGAHFEHSGTKTEDAYKFRVYRCSECSGTFRVLVKTEILFCKVTKAGEGTTL